MSNTEVETARESSCDHEPISVCVVLAAANELSIPLEVASNVSVDDIDVTVLSLFEPGDATFGVDVSSLSVESQYDPRAYARLFRFLRQRQFDVVHVHANFSGAITRILAQFTGDALLVTTEHNSHQHFGRTKNLINGVTNTLNDAIVLNSECTEESLHQWEKFLLSAFDIDTGVIHNGVNVDRIRNPSDTLPVDLPDHFLIGHCGRMCYQKNQPALINATAPLIQEHGDVSLVLTGDGPTRAKLETLCREHGIRDDTYFLGYLPRRDQIYELFKHLNVFVFPSRFEGFGVAAAEAMTAGVPVVANNLPVLREVLGDAALYVDATDTDRLSETVDSVYEDDQVAEELSEAGRSRGETQFSISNTVSEYVDLYRRLTE